MKRTRKPIIYVENHLLRSVKKLGEINRYIDGSTRLKKSELRQLMDELKEPLMRAVGYVFPDEDIDDKCPKCDSDIIDNSCTKCKFNYNNI